MVTGWAQHAGHSQPCTRTLAGGSPRREAELRVWDPEPSWGRSRDSHIGSPLPPGSPAGFKSRVRRLGQAEDGAGVTPNSLPGSEVQEILKPGYELIVLLLKLPAPPLCLRFSVGSTSLSVLFY